MIFHNLNLFRLGASVDLTDLQIFLDTRPFSPCLPSQEKAAGFANIFGLKSRVFTANDCFLFCLLIQEKIPPAAALRSAGVRETQAFELKHKRRPSAAEKAEIKEKVRDKLVLAMPQDLARDTETWAYIDPNERLLVVNSSSSKIATAMVQLIKGVLSNGIAFPLRPQANVAETLGHWLNHECAPEPFMIGSKCELTDQDRGTIKYNYLSLEQEQLRQYLQDGMKVKNLALGYNNRCSFVLGDDLMVKEFKLTDLALSDHDAGSGEPLEGLAGDLTLMSNEVKALVHALLDNLGGEVKF
jgi:recombination associated protein RdgC